MGGNLRGEYKRRKTELLIQIQTLDTQEERRHLSEEESQKRGILKEELEHLMELEELYWQQRGGEKWVLEGDMNSSFFHLVANGRKRRKAIMSLEHEGGTITEPSQIQEAIYTYYKQLFGKSHQRKVSLTTEVWENSRKLTEEDNELLCRPFTEEEVKRAVFDMKENTALGPDGFGVYFYRKCWNIIKNELMSMINDFYMNNLDIARLNYGVITLIPKVQDANDVKQYRPICLLNVSFKIFTKLLMDRLSKFAGEIISPNQTAFIKGRYIVDGAVMLHEGVHELHSKKMRG